MKANRIPRKDRFQRRIHSLEDREYNAWVKSTPGNPYRKCKYCGVHTPQASISGHHSYCKIKGISKEIAHYYSLMMEEH